MNLLKTIGSNVKMPNVFKDEAASKWAGNIRSNMGDARSYGKSASGVNHAKDAEAASNVLDKRTMKNQTIMNRERTSPGDMQRLANQNTNLDGYSNQLAKSGDDFALHQAGVAEELRRLQGGANQGVVNGLKQAPGVAKDYLFGGSAGQIAARNGALVGGYLGVNAAGRALSGGGLAHNNQGQRDIAGIPFL